MSSRPVLIAWGLLCTNYISAAMLQPVTLTACESVCEYKHMCMCTHVGAPVQLCADIMLVEFLSGVVPALRTDRPCWPQPHPAWKSLSKQRQPAKHKQQTHTLPSCSLHTFKKTWLHMCAHALNAYCHAAHKHCEDTRKDNV